MDAMTDRALLHRRPRHVVTAVVAAVGLFATLSACSTPEPERTPVELAQADVAAKEKALTEAQTAVTDASAEFCRGGSRTSWRWTATATSSPTAVTVGDVNDAGSDLEEPREDAMSGAEAAVSAQQAVVDAEQELAEAKAALKRRRTPARLGAAPAGEHIKQTQHRGADADVNRVEQAEKELELPGRAQRGHAARPGGPAVQLRRRRPRDGVAQAVRHPGCLPDDGRSRPNRP